MLGDTFAKLGESILTTDIYILFFALVTLFAFLFTLWAAGAIKKEKKNFGRSPYSLYTAISVGYTVFTVFITLFPLFGMLGTVFGLLGLDLATGDMENIKENFFVALTSTAWGIIFSAVFKIVDAFVKTHIEDQIEMSKSDAFIQRQLDALKKKTEVADRDDAEE